MITQAKNMEGQKNLMAELIKFRLKASCFKDLQNAATLDQLMEWVSAMVDLALSVMKISAGFNGSEILDFMSKARMPHALVRWARPHALSQSMTNNPYDIITACSIKDMNNTNVKSCRPRSGGHWNGYVVRSESI